MSAHIFTSTFNTNDARLLFWLNYILVKCARQPEGTNLCGFYVCEFIRTYTTEHKDYRFDVSNPLSILSDYRHFFLLSWIDVHMLISFLYIYSSRRCGIVSCQSNAWRQLETRSRDFCCQMWSPTRPNLVVIKKATDLCCAGYRMYGLMSRWPISLVWSPIRPCK